MLSRPRFPLFPCSSVRRRLIALGCALGVVLVADDAAAQRGQGAQYRPAQPTMSPYIGLLQTNVGPIPNYFSLVRPRQEQRAFNRQLQATTRVQSLQIQQLSSGTPQQPSAPQTGKAAGFMQHLHYYPQVQPVPHR